MQTIDNVLSARNLTESCAGVVKNREAGGIDRMSVGQLKSYLDLNREELCETIREGKYIPQPIRGKEISKRNGKTRMFGIPTVVDRMLQQAVTRVIMPQFEYMFSEQLWVPATTEYVTGGTEIVGVHQFRVSTHCRNRPEGIFRRSRPLLVTGFVAPEREMPRHHASCSQVVKGAHMGKWRINQTEKRRTTGQPYQPVTIQHHVT